MDDICAPMLTYLAVLIACVVGGIALGWAMKGWHNAS
jgi:hypothetical protein